MTPAAPASQEHERLQALHELGLLDTPREERFDRYVRIARRLFATPVSLLSLVDRTRQWFKAASGIDIAETPRSVSFCGHALHRRGVFYVPDAQLDARFADNPLVIGQPCIRFYAGAPLFVAEGLAVGALCVIDQRPRTLDVAELRALRDLADCVQRELRLQRWGWRSLGSPRPDWQGDPLVLAEATAASSSPTVAAMHSINHSARP